MSRSPQPTRPPTERILVCGVRFREAPKTRDVRTDPAEERGEVDPDRELEEVRGLVRAVDAELIGRGVLQRRDRPHPGTLMGKGKVEEIAELIRQHEPDAVVVDNDLSPAQGRNLEKAWKTRIIDRSELILDIFARRAKTPQARLQVELAQNEYLLPRLTRMWTHLERMEGAVGTRGPGETQLETDRRLLRKRIHQLRSELNVIEARKQREVASRHDHFTIGLVGYTNAGKSTLLNALTGADELVADMLFATLDTRTRRWNLSDGRVVLLSDTVGFLQRLPHHLVASFHATLEEALHADLLLHVVDASHSQAAQQMRAVEEVLEELSMKTRTDILVFNKVDQVEEPLHLTSLWEDREEPAVYLSAKSGEGIERLDELVRTEIDRRSAEIDVFVSAGDGKLLSVVRKLGGILEEEHLEEEGQTTTRVRTKLTQGAMGYLQNSAGGRARFEIVKPASGLAWAEDVESWPKQPTESGS